MAEYHRDSLRELRRMAEARPERKKGSVLITILIVVLFLVAAGFYVKTVHPEWWNRFFKAKAVEQQITEWKDDVADVFKSESDDVRETVDSALENRNEKA